MITLDGSAAVPGGETVSSLRARILLGILADAEARRLGLTLGVAELEDTARWYRARFDLLGRRDFEAFMKFAGLDLSGFSAQMRTFWSISEVQLRYTARIESLLPRYRAIVAARSGTDRREVLR